VALSIPKNGDPTENGELTCLYVRNLGIFLCGVFFITHYVVITRIERHYQSLVDDHSKNSPNSEKHQSIMNGNNQHAVQSKAQECVNAIKKDIVTKMKSAGMVFVLGAIFCIPELHAFQAVFLAIVYAIVLIACCPALVLFKTRRATAGIKMDNSVVAAVAGTNVGMVSSSVGSG
jgi:hypothetical protein